MPDSLVEPSNRCGKADRRQALQVLGRGCRRRRLRAACEWRGACSPAGGAGRGLCLCDILAGALAAGARRGRGGLTCPSPTGSIGRRRRVAVADGSSPQGWSPPAGCSLTKSRARRVGGGGAPRQVEVTSRATSRPSARAGVEARTGCLGRCALPPNQNWAAQ